jgi:uncharacterized membrane protein YdjX (TVP38/TMEM64 family)
MDVLRGRLLGELREADRHGRLAVYYPRVPDLGSQCLMVHAKLAIVDDRLLRIGSANLSNRSMGLDTECDLSIEAQSDGERAAVAGLRRRLLGMFLELAPTHLAEAESREQGLIPAIESLRGNGRSLAPLSAEVDPEWERQLPDDRLVDPDSPLSTDDLSEAMLGRHHLPVARRRLWITLGMVVALLAMAAAWRWTPLSEWLDPGLIAAAVSSTLHGPLGPLLLTLGFVAASLVAVPVTFLILVTALIYGPLTGGIYALLGAVLSALAGYGVGSYLGRPTVERLSGGSLYRLSERLARRGLLTVITVRVVPVAPFAVINLFAGASHIQFRDYVIGTVIGMLPGTAALAVFAEGILGMLEGASLRDFLVILLAVVFIIGMSVLARHLLSLANGQRKKTNHTE